MIARSVIGTAWGMAAYKANIITTHDMLLDAVFRHLHDVGAANPQGLL